jgi:acetoacetyl-CoA reductase
MTQRIAVVTGGMGGIGEVICMHLAKAGFKVVATISNKRSAE